MSRTIGMQHTDSVWRESKTKSEQTKKQERGKIQQFISILLLKAIHKYSASYLPQCNRFYGTQFWCFTSKALNRYNPKKEGGNEMHLDKRGRVEPEGVAC